MSPLANCNIKGTPVGRCFDRVHRPAPLPTTCMHKLSTLHLQPITPPCLLHAPALLHPSAAHQPVCGTCQNSSLLLLRGCMPALW